MNDGSGELGTCVGSTDVSCTNFLFLEDFADRVWYFISKSRETQVSQHHNWADQDWGRVCLVFSSDS